MNEIEISVKSALNQLKNNGFKYTTKREKILRFLAEKNKYVTAKEVYQYLVKEYKGMSYDTVYRNLNTLGILGIIEITELSNEKRFLLHCEKLQHTHHHHFICTQCGLTQEIEMCPIADMTADLDDCEITGHKFEIYGKCAKCLNGN